MKELSPEAATNLAEKYFRQLEGKVAPEISQGFYDAAMWLISVRLKQKPLNGACDKAQDVVSCKHLSTSKQTA